MDGNKQQMLIIKYKNKMELKLGLTVFHEKIYWGKEPMKIVGIREKEVELEGDYSGGTHGVCQKDWQPIDGLLFSKSEKPYFESKS